MYILHLIVMYPFPVFYQVIHQSRQAPSYRLYMVLRVGDLTYARPHIS